MLLNVRRRLWKITLGNIQGGFVPRNSYKITLNSTDRGLQQWVLCLCLKTKRSHVLINGALVLIHATHSSGKITRWRSWFHELCGAIVATTYHGYNLWHQFAQLIVALSFSIIPCYRSHEMINKLKIGRICSFWEILVLPGTWKVVFRQILHEITHFIYWFFCTSIAYTEFSSLSGFIRHINRMDFNAFRSISC